MKKALIFIILTISLLACSCAKKDRGEITLAEDEDVKPVMLEEGGEYIFGKGESLKGYTEFEDNLAGLSFSYPEDWDCSMQTSNYIVFRDDRNIIIVYHRIIPEMEEPRSLQEFVNSFESMLEEEVIESSEKGPLQRREKQELTKLSVESKDPLLIRQYYEDVRFRDDMQSYVTGVFSETRYYLRYNSVDTVISQFGPDSEVVDGMVNNLKTLPVSVEGQSVIFEDGEYTILPGNFIKQKEGRDTYYIPKENDPFTGCFAVVKRDGNEVDEDYLDSVFESVFGGSFENHYGAFELPIFTTGKAMSCNVGTDEWFPHRGMSYIIEARSCDGANVIVGYPAGKKELLEKYINARPEE